MPLIQTNSKPEAGKRGESKVNLPVNLSTLRSFGPEIESHARRAIGVKSLPLNSPTEVDAIFQM